MKLKLILAVVASSLCASAAAISNGTFDSSCTGWTSANIDSNGGCRSTEGNPGGMFIINNGGSLASDPSIQQSLTGLVIGQSYVLSGDYHNYWAPCCNILPNNVNAFGVEIDGVRREFDVAEGGPTSAWQQFSFQFTYTGNSPILRLIAEINNLDVDVAVDNISIADVPVGVPEPGTLALAGAGLVAIALRSRRA